MKGGLGCGGPCRAHGCDLCCRETRMPLSRVDVARQKVREILRDHHPLPIPDDLRKEMDEVVAAYSS